MAMDVELADQFIAAVRAIGCDDRPAEVTSARRVPAVADALRLGRDLGVLRSASAFGEQAVVDGLEALAHTVAVEAHFAIYPEDRPSSAELAVVALDRLGVTADEATIGRAARTLEAAGIEVTVNALLGAVTALVVPAA